MSSLCLGSLRFLVTLVNLVVGALVAATTAQEGGGRVARCRNECPLQLADYLLHVSV